MIRSGIGGWTFEPWRETFYPPDVPKARELHYASRTVTTIEINSTFYRTQSPASFKRWAAETPEGFVFSVKANRFAVTRKVLAQAGPAIEHFIGSGITELGAKLGPIFWQLMPAKTFDAGDVGAFLDLLPREAGGQALRHVVEVRHRSFQSPEFVALARAANVAIAYVDSEKHAPIADATSDFVYARLERTQAAEATGYPKKEIARWAARAKEWEAGGAPKDLPLVAEPAKKMPRDVFIYFISGAKERAPAAAMAFLEALKK